MNKDFLVGVLTLGACIGVIIIGIIMYKQDYLD